MRHLQLLFIAIFLCVGFVQAQDTSIESLKAMMAEKQAAADALAAEAAAIQAEIDALPGWEKGAFGKIGFDGIVNNDWFALATPNSQNAGLNLGLGGFANYDNEDLFWNNSLSLNLARVASYLDKNDDATKTIALTNNFLDFSSLGGKKLSPKWAITGELKWVSTLVEFEAGDSPVDDKYKFSLNNPGQATFSVGLSWLPIKNMTVSIHPLAYQKNWPGELISNAGCKIGATYAAEILPNVSWNSNLNAFLPYGGAGPVEHALADGTLRTVDYAGGDLTSWQWINSFTTNIWKGIGVKFDLGLAGNRQVANLARLAGGDVNTDISDNPLQSYYGLGLAYTM